MGDRELQLVVEQDDPHAELKKELEAKRRRNREQAEAAAKAGEEKRLREEIAYEEARAAAYEKYGVSRVIGGEIRGAGFVILRKPTQAEWRLFANRGLLKPDKITEELCGELVYRCLVWPSPAGYEEILKLNPNASVSLTSQITEAMSSKDLAEGKE